MKLQVGSSEVKGIYKRAEWINLDLQNVSDDAKKAFIYKMKVAENKELQGFKPKPPTEDEQFEEVFGRKRSNKNPMAPKTTWN
ncbi:MAG: hypothetical protein NWE76_01470, partial [Candidatus Bathyarchaeota archaeon]|nr:hypothetical protein [Candidatus Bathyarchaeota archaeon]